jgi:hypothetical protein
MKHIIVDDKIYEIKTTNIISILQLLEDSFISKDADTVKKNIYNAISLTKEIIFEEMHKQTPITLDAFFGEEE